MPILKSTDPDKYAFPATLRVTLDVADFRKIRFATVVITTAEPRPSSVVVTPTSSTDHPWLTPRAIEHLKTLCFTVVYDFRDEDWRQLGASRQGLAEEVFDEAGLSEVDENEGGWSEMLDQQGCESLPTILILS